MIIRVKYQWIIDQGQGGTLALLLMFTQPVDDQILIFPSEVLVQYLASPTDVLIEVELPVTSPTLQFEMEIIYMKNMQEPCLVNGACESTAEQGCIDRKFRPTYLGEGGLISESFSLWLQPPKKGPKLKF